PLVVHFDSRGAAVFALLRGAYLGAHDAAGAFVLRPEIDALDTLDFFLDLYPFGNDVAVAEPGRFLVDVVLRAALLGRFHGPGARDRHARRGVQRPEVRLGDSGGDVVTADQLLADEEIDIFPLLHLDGRLVGRLRGGRRGQQGGQDYETAH